MANCCFVERNSTVPQYDETLSVQHGVLCDVAGRFGLSMNHNPVGLFGTVQKLRQADVPLHLLLMF
jgi:hypothetical protein